MTFAAEPVWRATLRACIGGASSAAGAAAAAHGTAILLPIAAADASMRSASAAASSPECSPREFAGVLSFVGERKRQRAGDLAALLRCPMLFACALYYPLVLVESCDLFFAPPRAATGPLSAVSVHSHITRGLSACILSAPRILLLRPRSRCASGSVLTLSDVRAGAFNYNATPGPAGNVHTRRATPDRPPRPPAARV